MNHLNYHTTLLEDTVKKIYSHLDIYHPRQLDTLEIANSLDIKVHFINISSRTYKGEIIIDSRLSPEEQWEDFAHELCHVLLQYGNQIINLDSLFLKYQEWKANNFALHFCVPTFMLQKSLLIHKIASIPEAIPFIKNQYNVTDEIAEKRLIHFRNQLQISKLHSVERS
ncbi:ImmA/IrrE family metallo-endopeptidase [Lederbergia sp. NSJ-179]|uniref:ImmA/IrrE family metallo-endopeptidase n=1 Tax=Lederbergia sp. NSJ-179 TaxID=2931402 RepID=UPI001FD1637B|nr:ImmA/IrrE family metallo-endopeptidase [Lederbergia sp. NSJ-179]MCJ7842639.1 ImmA/IrrE family metallo-endopeptidase [Lederbergia sp. NSJ-179]